MSDPNGHETTAPPIVAERHDSFERATLATAIVGVIVVCLYTGIAGYQAWIAKDTAKRQLRAYLSVVVEKQPDLNALGSTNVTMLVRNNGQTPAYNVETRSIISVLNGAELTDAQADEIDSYVGKLEKSRSTLSPGQEFRTSPETQTGIPLTPEQKILIGMGAMTLWVTGKATYTDAFGYPHFTHFRLSMTGAVGRRYEKMVWADVGNDAD